MSWGQLGKPSLYLQKTKLSILTKEHLPCRHGGGSVMFCDCFVAFATECLQRVQGLDFCAGFFREYLHIPAGSALISREIPTSLSAWKTIGTDDGMYHLQVMYHLLTNFNIQVQEDKSIQEIQYWRDDLLFFFLAVVFICAIACHLFVFFS